MTIICFAGIKNSGKDEASSVLVSRYGFTRVALADPLRELCSRVFKLDYNLFSDNDKKDKPLEYKVMLDYHHIDQIRDIVENEWEFVVDDEAREDMEDYYGNEFKTPREILQLVGTQLIRNNVRDDIWIVLAFSRMREIGEKIVITDARFKNEREAFRKAGATLCLIKRDTGNASETHESETQMGTEDDYDVIFTNNEKLHQFKSEVDLWYNTRRTELQFYKKYKYEY